MATLTYPSVLLSPETEMANSTTMASGTPTPKNNHMSQLLLSSSPRINLAERKAIIQHPLSKSRDFPHNPSILDLLPRPPNH
ncbi:unnamed protein product [Linum trigynum]|uniref:Uncharacterized protein n=1 Tax=Linum trigynum TaxID=586398 RepID=A0AAV2CX11_9ROSI